MANNGQQSQVSRKPTWYKRPANVLTLILVVVWAGLLFAPSGPFRPWLDSTVDSVEASYIQKFRWNTLADRSSVLSGSSDSADIVIFIDYGCRFCKMTEAVVDSFRSRYPSIQIGYRHLAPRSNMRSRQAALAAICANENGLFGDIHRPLYDVVLPDSASKETTFVESLDQRLPSVSARTVRECLNTSTNTSTNMRHARGRFHADSILADRLNIRATPTLIGRGSKLVGLPTFDRMVHAFAGRKR